VNNDAMPALILSVHTAVMDYYEVEQEVAATAK
jgi:hypothetical protein